MNKRKDDPFDDFFALSAPADKKKKRRRSRPKLEDKNEGGATNSSPRISEDWARKEDLPERKELHLEDIVVQSPEKSKKAKTLPKLGTSEEIISIDDSITVPDEEEDELLEFLKETSASIEHASSESYKFSDSNERRRSYLVRVLCKLDPDSTVSVDIGTKGLKRFDKIHEAVIKELRKRTDSPGGPPLMHYTMHTTSMAWIEGRREIKPFFKPSTFRLNPPSQYVGKNPASIPLTHIPCLLYPKSRSFLEYPEFETNTSWKKLSQLSSELSNMDETVLSAELSDDEGDFPVDSQPGAHPRAQVDAEYFEIGLKGKDNKRVSVQVCSTTKIMDVLLHYLKTKNIGADAAKSTKLIFDDEPLDLDGMVGDTELEDEYEVQVVM